MSWCALPWVRPKRKSANKIDPAVAALMAFGTWQTEHEYFEYSMTDKHKEKLRLFEGI